MALSDELKKFVSIFGRDGIDIGSVSFNESEVNTALNDELMTMYKLLQFDKVITIGGEMFINLLPESRLEKAQQGWYLIKKDNAWIQDDEKWNKEWVVFSNRNDDAIYFDKIEKKIKGTIDKKIFFRLADSLSQFFSILTACMELEQNKYGFETRNDNEEVSQNFLSDILVILEQLDAGEFKDEFIEFFFG
jgi:hypothetical protein